MSEGKKHWTITNAAVKDEWARDLNQGLVPEDLPVSSRQSFWWRCQHGHLQKTRISRRIQSGCSGCREECRRRQSAEQLWKELAWLIPMLQTDSNDKASLEFATKRTPLVWECIVCRLPFVATIADRIRKDERRRELCSTCGGKRRSARNISTRINKTGSLAARFPHLVAEWAADLNGEVGPEQITSASNQAFWWRCEVGHEWKTKVGNRTLLDRGCPQCHDPSTSMLELRLFCELGGTDGNFHLREQVGGYEADLFSSKYGIVIECDGYPWHADDKVVRRDRQKDKAWQSLGYKVLRVRDGKLPEYRGNVIAFREMGTRNHLDIVIEVSRVLFDLAPNADEYRELHQKLVATGFQREICYQELRNQRVSRAQSRLMDVRPDLIPEWDVTLNHPMSPARVSAGSDYLATWRCSTCGDIWKARVANRVKLNRGCPKCARSRVISKRRAGYIRGGNSLQEKAPEIAGEWHPQLNQPVKPSDVAPGSSRRFHWLCPACGHVWQTSVANRVLRGSGCPRCFRSRKSR